MHIFVNKYDVINLTTDYFRQPCKDIFYRTKLSNKICSPSTIRWLMYFLSVPWITCWDLDFFNLFDYFKSTVDNDLFLTKQHADFRLFAQMNRQRVKCAKKTKLSRAGKSFRNQWTSDQFRIFNVRKTSIRNTCLFLLIIFHLEVNASRRSTGNNRILD